MAKEPTNLIRAALLEQGKKVTRDGMQVWNTASRRRVMDAAGGRTEQDAQRDSRGALEGRRKNQLHEIADSFTDPTWTGTRWEFHVMHAKAIFHEWGAQPHDIEAKNAEALAFEWPDAPDDVYENTGNTEDQDLFFFDNTDHPGIPGIGFLTHGRDEAGRRLKDAGYDVSGFESDPSGGGS